MSFQTKTKNLLFITAGLLLVLPALLVVVPLNRADAATLTTTYLRPYRLKTGVTTKMRLVFTTASAGATSATIDMDGADSSGKWSSSSGSVHNGSMTTDVTTCATETGATGLPGSISVTGASGHTISISSITALSATTTYCVDFTNSDAVTNATNTGGPNTDGEYHPTVTVGSDSVTVAVRIIAEDSVVVTATVPPSFNFAFNNTSTDAFGNLSTGSTVSTTGKQITLTTNANSGWIVWAKSLNGTTKGSLKSATAGNYMITSSSSLGSASHTMSNGTEDYGLAVTIQTNAAGGGTPAADAAYDGSSTKVGVLDSQNFRPIASSGGTANGDVINVLERATISGNTPAANDYTDTITFIGAGSF